jgi:hypothetical protein
VIINRNMLYRSISIDQKVKDRQSYTGCDSDKAGLERGESRDTKPLHLDIIPK